MCARVLLAVLLASAVAQAQSAPITSYEVRYYAAGASVPLQVFPLPAGVYTCNLPPSGSTLTTNPSRIEWDDPQASGRACRYVEVAGGPLLSFPVGNYDGTLIAFNSAGASPESARAPFAIGVVPGTPTGFRVVR